MTFTAITHHTSPYSTEYIHEKGNVGLEDDFKSKRRGLGNKRQSANRQADSIIDAIKARLLEAESLGIENPGDIPRFELEALIRKAKRNGT